MPISRARTRHFPAQRPASSKILPVSSIGRLSQLALLGEVYLSLIYCNRRIPTGLSEAAGYQE